MVFDAWGRIMTIRDHWWNSARWKPNLWTFVFYRKICVHIALFEDRFKMSKIPWVEYIVIMEYCWGSRIYWCTSILDLPQHVSASHYHNHGGVVTSEATQAISVLWMYMDYNSSGVASCGRMWPRSHLSTSDHTGRIVSHIYILYIHNTDCL
jgi:hypothetical protein